MTSVRDATLLLTVILLLASVRVTPAPEPDLLAPPVQAAPAQAEQAARVEVDVPAACLDGCPSTAVEVRDSPQLQVRSARAHARAHGTVHRLTQSQDGSVVVLEITLDAESDAESCPKPLKRKA